MLTILGIRGRQGAMRVEVRGGRVAMEGTSRREARRDGPRFGGGSQGSRGRLEKRENGRNPRAGAKLQEKRGDPGVTEMVPRGRSGGVAGTSFRSPLH